MGGVQILLVSDSEFFSSFDTGNKSPFKGQSIDPALGAQGFYYFPISHNTSENRYPINKISSYLISLGIRAALE